MKKKGFTLVELLAVIAILAILVIIALPNVMGMFNTAKKNSFTTEVKEIFKQAEQQWISDSMLETKEIAYSRGTGNTSSTTPTDNPIANCGKKLDLTGRKELQYAIVINKAGQIVRYVATDGTYVFDYKATGSNSLSVENIVSSAENEAFTNNANDNVKVYTLTDANFDKVTISCSVNATTGVHTVTAAASAS